MKRWSWVLLVSAVVGAGCQGSNRGEREGWAVPGDSGAQPPELGERSERGERGIETIETWAASGRAANRARSPIEDRWVANLRQERAPLAPPDVFYVPSPQPVVDKMLELAHVRDGDVVYDLGCGDGRIVVTAAKRYAVEARGFDIDPERVAQARENVRRQGVEHLVTIEQKDLFTLDLSEVDVVALYLLPEVNTRLIPQLKQMRPGSVVVSHAYPIGTIQPTKVVQVPVGEKTHVVYLWYAPITEDEQ